MLFVFLTALHHISLNKHLKFDITCENILKNVQICEFITREMF